MALSEAFAALAGTDIYLIDQILRGRVQPGMRVLDVGCGAGRNLPALAALGCAITGIDRDAGAVQACRQRLAGRVDPARIQHGDLLAAGSALGGPFDLVLVNAVLHFTDDAAAFEELADACWAQRAADGVLFARLSTRIALPAGVHPPGFGYLPDEQALLACEQRWGARRLDPLKTTLVERVRTMTTWVLGA